MVRNQLHEYTRIFFFLGGFFLLALGINLMITAPQFGLSPWDSLFVALTTNFGMSIGFWMFILNVVFLTAVYFLHRSYVNWATIVNVLLISVLVDALHFLCHDYLLKLPDGFAFLTGAILIGSGIGMYVSASFGFAPQEGFMLAVSEKLKWTYRRTEILVSFIVLGCSFLLDGPIYWGTIFLTIAIGFIIQFSIEQSNKVLKRLKTNDNKGETT